MKAIILAMLCVALSACASDTICYTEDECRLVMMNQQIQGERTRAMQHSLQQMSKAFEQHPPQLQPMQAPVYQMQQRPRCDAWGNCW